MDLNMEAAIIAEEETTATVQEEKAASNAVVQTGTPESTEVVNEEVVPSEVSEENKTKRMSRSTYNLIVRLIGGIAAALILVSGTILLSNFIQEKRMENASLLSQASGLKDSTAIMNIDDEVVTAEEYLYWVANYCTQFSYYYGITDFSEDMGEGMSFADYIKTMAEENCAQYATIRAWAKELGISLTEEDLQTIQDQLSSYNSYYEDPKDAALFLKIQGLSNTLLSDKLLTSSLLYTHITEEYTNGSLRPSNKDLDMLVEKHSLVTAKMLEVAPSSYEEEDVDAAQVTVQSYIARLEASSDINATWAEIAEELGQEDVSSVYDCCEETAVCTTLEGLGVGEFGSAEDDDGCHMILLRVDTDYDQISSIYCNDAFESRNAGVTKTYTDAYNSLDVSAFYTKFVTLQSQAYASLPSATSDGTVTAVE